jgi:DNA-binding NtrC family response regulator
VLLTLLSTNRIARYLLKANPLLCIALMKLLLVDDEKLVLDTLGMLLGSHGYEVFQATTEAQALGILRNEQREIALVLLDYHLGGQAASGVVPQMRAIVDNIFVLMLSGDETRDVLKDSWACGANAFLDKSAPTALILDEIAAWCAKYEKCAQPLPQHSTQSANELSMIGDSPVMLKLYEQLKRYRCSDQTVLIVGETGTGKELVARALHENVSTFYAINCAAYSGNSDLLESELFGHERGAFTGALRDKTGIFESCDGGMIFLDEVHHLPISAQAKLLRVCQEKKIRKVGGNREIPVKFRLVASAKPDLEERCKTDLFLVDLYHRLNVLRIEVPCLSNRIEDIEPLVRHFTWKYSERTGVKKNFLLSTVRQMQLYSWPGNVRELENTVNRLLTDCPQELVTVEQLEPKFFAPIAQTYSQLKSRHLGEEKKLVENILNRSVSKSEAALRLEVSPSTLHGIMKRIGLY